MAEQNDNLGSTILELDEKSLAELRENGFLLVAFPGGNAKLALAQLDKVFIAEYGETDVDLIEEQINLGKICFCKHNSFNRYFPLGHYNAKSTHTPRIIVFNGYGNGSIDDIRIMDSSWSYNQGQRLEDKGELVDQTVTVSEGKISVNNNARASVTLSNLNAFQRDKIFLNEMLLNLIFLLGFTNGILKYFLSTNSISSRTINVPPM